LDQAAARQIQQRNTTIKHSVFAHSTLLQVWLHAFLQSRLNTSYTFKAAMRAMWEASLPTAEANREGNLKNGADISPVA
jgi:hypothetical protein